jgi:hypothetical protein
MVQIDIAEKKLIGDVDGDAIHRPDPIWFSD